MELHSINRERRLYVIMEGGGVTAIGFEIAYDRAVKVAKWCGSPLPDANNVGTEEGFKEYAATMSLGRLHYQATKQRCDADLTPQLIGHEGKRVEVIDKDDNKRRFWVGKSTGWFPVHIEIVRVNAKSGDPVSGAPFKSVTVVRTK